MEFFLVVLTALAVCVSETLAQIQYCDLYPPEVQKCFKEATRHPVHVVDAHAACIKRFYVNSQPDLNLTKADREFFHYRAKTKFGLLPPPSGPRIRKEYRRLSKEERIRLHAAFNVLYKEGVVHRFGRLHAEAAEANTIHDGSSFLPWHRVFITDFEEELRRVDPKVSLAYWDHTLDVNMTKPSDSVVWTPCFFGNGNGTITEGPFRGWYGGRDGPVQRDYARGECDTGRLINKIDLLNVLSKCRLQDISKPPDGLPFNLESLHDGGHLWVGGDMGELTLSAFDPVFYFHHAFVDYVWELFRRNQALRCGVDPEMDYPVDKKTGEHGGHRAFDRMYGYEYLRNVDGLSKIFTKAYYQYEALPSCPHCGSEYLVCDFKRQQCVSRDKRACDMPRNAQGQHTYTGRGIDSSNIGFNGRMESSFTTFPKHKPFHNYLPADRRSRDHSYAEAMEIAVRQEGKSPFSSKKFPFSPIMSLHPPMTGSFPGSQFPSPLSSPLAWPYKSGSWSLSKLAGPQSSVLQYPGHGGPIHGGLFPGKYGSDIAPQPIMHGYGAPMRPGPPMGAQKSIFSSVPPPTFNHGSYGPPPLRPALYPGPMMWNTKRYPVKRGYY